MDNKISEWLNNFKNNDKDISKKIEKLSIKNQKLITANRKLQLEKENIELKHQELILKMQGYQKDVDNLYEKVEEYTIRYGEICKSDNNFDFEYDKNIIDSLNSKLKNPYSYDQTRAIAYDMQRHLRIVAGAGAGKTETICGKAIYLRDVERINGSEILVTTFTKKAQLEIEERIIKLEPGSSTDIKVGTLNAWFQQEYNLLKKQYLRSEDLIIDGNIDDLKYHQLLNKLIQEYDLEKFL